jgi:hypothetical protein
MMAKKTEFPISRTYAVKSDDGSPKNTETRIKFLKRTTAK